MPIKEIPVRNIITVLSLALAAFTTACTGPDIDMDVDNDDVAWQQPNDESATPSGPSETTNDEESEVAEEDEDPSAVATTDEPSEDDDLDNNDCWFAAWEYYNDYDIGVKTLPVYRLVSPAEVTVAPGEDIVLSFAISSYNTCGDIDFNLFFFGLFDRGEESYTWLKKVNDDALPMSLEDVSGESEFGTFIASNMYVTPTGDQLHYVWQDGNTNWSTQNYPVNMATERVGANEEKVYEFIWTASDYAPSGTTMTVSLNEVCWTDVTTNGSPCSTYQGLEDIEMTVHIK